MPIVTSLPSGRAGVRALLESRRTQRLIVAVIVVNAAALGLETVPQVLQRHGPLLHAIDRVALGVFVTELAAKVYAYRAGFVRDRWNLFDAAIVGVSLIPHSGGLTVLRALRILRALRLISTVPSLRRVVSALLGAMPGVASIAVLLALVLYVAAVMASKLFGATAPEHFGDLGSSLFTLFRIMSGEGWSDVARAVMVHHRWAWLFFVGFILVCTFVVLNLFIAVIVNAMEDDAAKAGRPVPVRKDSGDETTAMLLAEIAALRAEIRALCEERGRSRERDGEGDAVATPDTTVGP
ncbi:ion transporter [Thermomonospora catenispora]|uniref:ion transporter n=1 Tax=Thermomonospora catenispora TaxID=2493090 RepID=UPI0011228FB2|nr:ion transporter [Thermomonospora catenispora]TNY37274.1 ion transporter [Thermomonospora catenispora]